MEKSIETFFAPAPKAGVREIRTEMTSAHKPDKKPIETYEHKDKQRLNNPPVGLVMPETDQEEGSRSYSHDPHLDPQLIWAGKAEHTSFLVPTVSLHVHERIEFSRVEPLPGTHWLHADAETRGDAQRATVSFGPEHAPLDYDGRSLYPPPGLLPAFGSQGRLVAPGQEPPGRGGRGADRGLPGPRFPRPSRPGPTSGWQ
jgi:hypothetical protein